MKILGIDNGYSFTKDSDGNIFKSSFTKSQMIMNDRKLDIDGTTYYIGQGSSTCDVDKTDSDMNIVTTLYSMCQCVDNDFKLVVGLPIGQYKQSKDKLKECIAHCCHHKVEYKGKERRFSIHDVLVAPQGASVLYYSGITDDCVIVDVGGLTVDVAQIEFDGSTPRIMKSNTYYKGMRTLYQDIIESINLKYNLRLNSEDADKIIRHGFTFKGERQDLSFLGTVLTRYIEPIYEELKLNYNTNSNKIVLVGGGAMFLYRAMVKRFGDVLCLDDSQFANAKGYYHLGINKWGKEV